MTQENRFRLADGLWFLVILILAFGARAWYLHACAKDGQGEGPLQVQETSLGGLVLLPGRTTESLESLPSRSLYPWLLDRLEAKTQDPESAGRWTRWIQAGLGALTAALYCLLAGRVLGSRWVGLVAGLLAAVYPFWIINTAELHDGVLATFLLAAALFLGGVGNQAGGGGLTGLLYGVALAALALTRGALLPFAWVALLWYCWRCRTLVHGWLCALLAILGFGLVLAPWTMRNYRELHNPLPIADEAYFHLWVGNHPARAGQFPAATGGPWQGDTMVVGEKDIQKTTHEFGEDVLEEVRQHPADTLQRRLNAGLYFFFGQEYFTNQRLWREKAAGTDVPEWFRNSYPGALFGSLLALFLLAVVGWRWSFPWPQSGLLAVAVLWIPLPYLLGHAGALQGPRLPLDGVFLCYAAYTLVGLFTCCRGGLTRRA